MITTHPAEKTLQLGFVGVGWIGRDRMLAILKNTKASATAIVEPHPDNAREALACVGDTALCESMSDLTSDPDLDGIVIATPSALHAEQSMLALNSGKAVFCQKPLGRTASEVREVVAASKKANKLLAVDLSYRYTRAFKAVFKAIQSGNIGHVYATDLVFHNAYGPDKEWFYDLERSGGGCVMDLGIHLIDLALWTLNFPEIKTVESHLYHNGQKWDPSGNQVEDFASVTITTEKQQIINLQCSWNISAGQDAVIEAKFYGTKGGMAFKNIKGSFYDFKAEKYTGTITDSIVLGPDEWSGRAGVVWAEKIADNARYDPVTAEEFIKTAEVIDRIYGR